MKHIQRWMALAALVVVAASLYAGETPEPVVVVKANGPVVFRIEVHEVVRNGQLIKSPLLQVDHVGLSIFQASGLYDLSTVEEWSLMRKAFIGFILSDFLEFDLDFEGGTWDQLAPVLIEKLHEAYETQVPPIAKGFMPEKLDIAFETVVGAKLPPRIGAIRKKACTLSWLPLKFPADKEISCLEMTDPLDAAILRARALGNATLPYDSRIFPKIWIKAPRLDDISTAYFNLNELPQRPNLTVEKSAADLAALLEISWKLNNPLVFAKTRLHPETGILIVQGSGEEIEAAEKAFRVLTGKKPEQSNSSDLLMEKLGGLAEVLQRREKAKEERENAEHEAKQAREEAELKAKEAREEAKAALKEKEAKKKDEF